MTKRKEWVNSQNGGIEWWCMKGEGSKRQKAEVEGRKRERKRERDRETKRDRESCWEFGTKRGRLV